MLRAPRQKSSANAKMAARDVPVRARARRSKVGMYAGSLPWGPIPSVLRRQDAATVLIHGCGSSATSCGSVACVVVILSKAREAIYAERLRRVMVERIRASYEPVCGAEGQGSTWWLGRWRAVLSHDASFGQDERQNLQPRHDAPPACRRRPKKAKLVVVHLNLQKGSAFRLPAAEGRSCVHFVHARSLRGDSLGAWLGES